MHTPQKKALFWFVLLYLGGLISLGLIASLLKAAIALL